MPKADNLPPYCAIVKKFGSLNFLDPPWACTACYGRALPLPFYCIYTERREVGTFRRTDFPLVLRWWRLFCLYCWGDCLSTGRSSASQKSQRKVTWQNAVLWGGMLQFEVVSEENIWEELTVGWTVPRNGLPIDCMIKSRSSRWTEL